MINSKNWLNEGYVRGFGILSEARYRNSCRKIPDNMSSDDYFKINDEICLGIYDPNEDGTKGEFVITFDEISLRLKIYTDGLYVYENYFQFLKDILIENQNISVSELKEKLIKCGCVDLTKREYNND